MSQQPFLYLLDTGILVTYARQGPLFQLIETHYALSRAVPPSVVSVVSRGEIAAFAKYNKWGNSKRQIVAQLLSGVVTLDINVRAVIDAYADVDTFSRQQKPARNMGKNDLWIAATAIVAQARILTTDTDFDHLCPALLRRDYIDQQTLQIVHG